MSEPDPVTTLREFKGYVDRSFESPGKIAARVGVTYSTIWAWLVGKYRPGVKSLPRLRAFLDGEAKRPVQVTESNRLSRCRLGS